MAAWAPGDTADGGDALQCWLEGQERPSVRAVVATHGVWARAVGQRWHSTTAFAEVNG